MTHSLITMTLLARGFSKPAFLNDGLTSALISVVLFVTACLFLLNVALGVAFRKRRLAEILSYVAAGLIELGIFVFVLLLRLGILTRVPLHLPPGLPINRAEIGAAIAIGIGLFPAAYWHRTSVSQMRQRMAEDAKVMKNRENAVRIRSNAPGEWMN